MNIGTWRYAFASVIGTSHERADLPCQDASDCRVIQAIDGMPVLIAVVAHGAGSAQRAEDGARITCAHIVSEVAAHFDDGGSMNDITRERAVQWVAGVRRQVLMCAEAEGLTPRDFACTALVAIAGADRTAFMQIGDGVIVVSRREEPDEYVWVFWPQRGEYANMTYFVTGSDAAEHLEFAIVEGRIDEVALLTDGLQPLALHYQSQTAHIPFFRPLFAEVQSAHEGFSPTLSASLAAFLQSPGVKARVDDDKTLVIATRRQVTQQPHVTNDSSSDANHDNAV